MRRELYVRMRGYTVRGKNRKNQKKYDIFSHNPSPAVPIEQFQKKIIRLISCQGFINGKSVLKTLWFILGMDCLAAKK